MPPHMDDHLLYAEWPGDVYVSRRDVVVLVASLILLAVGLYALHLGYLAALNY